MNTIIIYGLIFFAVTLLCVVLFTMKSIIIVKGSPLSGASVTAIAFGVNTWAVKLTASGDLWLTIPLTIVANFIGVFIAKAIIKTFQKDKLWRISCTIPDKKIENPDLITNELEKYNIESTVVPYSCGYIIDIFSKTQGESALIKEIITKYHIKYTVYEIEKSL